MATCTGPGCTPLTLGCNTAHLQVLGKDVNLGRHVAEDDAAKAYDKAAICARGKDVAKLNFSIDDYSNELEQLQSTTVAQLAPLLRSCPLLLTMPSLHVLHWHYTQAGAKQSSANTVLT